MGPQEPCAIPQFHLLAPPRQAHTGPVTQVQHIGECDMRYISNMVRNEPGTLVVTLMMIGLLTFGLVDLLTKVKIRTA